MKKAFLFILVLAAFCTLIGCGSTKQVTQLVRDVQRDSIPYEVTKIVTKEIQRPLTWFDKLCRICFILISVALFVLFVRLVFNLKSKLRI